MTTRQRKPAAPQPPQPSFGHLFRDTTLLRRALTHRSLSSETNPEALADPTADNEQLEFVGDAVLGLIVAESLFRRFPASREGELTRLRASLVSRRHLGEVAARIDLGSHLRLGRGEEASGGRAKPALLSNALEAVIAALYLDGGLTAARRFIEQHVIEPSLPDLDHALSDPTNGTFSGAIGDHKSALQEFLQAAGAGQPRYILAEETGPDHQKSFRVEVRVGDSDTALAASDGSTKKLAQQEAARLALARLRAEGLPSPSPVATR